MRSSSKQFRDAVVDVYADGSVSFQQAGGFQSVEVRHATAKQIVRYLTKRLETFRLHEVINPSRT